MVTARTPLGAPHSEHTTREPDSEQRSAAGIAHPEPAVAVALSLQRAAGNQAVARMLALRQAAVTGVLHRDAEDENDRSAAIEEENDSAADEDGELEESGDSQEDAMVAPDVAPVAEGRPAEPQRPAAEEPEVAVAAPEPAAAEESSRHAGRSLLRSAATPGSTATRTVQRRVVVRGTGSAWPELTRAERQSFVRRRFRGRRRRLASEIVADMAATSNDLRFDSLDEFYTEVLKRVTTATVMQSSQAPTSAGLSAFGYPFSGPSLLYGPRVNYAARNYWQPRPPDDFAVRRDPARVRTLRSLPRNERHTVYGDMRGPGYEWELTALGRANPYEAIDRLFVPQPPHRRTLIHCDYLVSLVHFQSLAASVGHAAFNARVRSFGPERIRLKWNAFADLGWTPTAAMGSLQVVHPANENDLVIGDHVYFWNHEAYDLLNARIGNAWRLENAVLIDRRDDTDVFLGHGSGRRTSQGMRAKLAQEYNDVAQIAMGLAARADRGDAAATSEIGRRFPNVRRIGGAWRVQGRRFNRDINMELRRIRPIDVLGLRDPNDPSRFYGVRRPVESR
jgi:hypothetical protein